MYISVHGSPICVSGGCYDDIEKCCLRNGVSPMCLVEYGIVAPNYIDANILELGTDGGLGKIHPCTEQATMIVKCIDEGFSKN